MALFQQTIHFPANFKKAAYDDAVGKLPGILQKIKRDVQSGNLPILQLAQTSDDLKSLQPIAKKFASEFKHVIILGTGGSSLGGKACYALADAGFGNRRGPQMHFMDNVDPHTFAALLEQLNPRDVGVIAISKSGSTAETLCQLHIIALWLGQNVKNQLLIITEPGGNVLRGIGESLGVQILEHNPKVGGRFSVLSNVGMLPAMIAGLDVFAIRAGAAEILQNHLDGEADESSASMGAVASIVLNQHHGIDQSVMMPYCDRLRTFAQWYKQLWAESLGKNGLGTTPVDAIGTVDQHSQLQLFLEGPRDKFFTFIFLHQAGLGQSVPVLGKSDKRLDYLYARRMGDLFDAEQRATMQTLKNRDLPVRLITAEKLDEKTLGGLFMHFMLETIIAADLLGVNPFDQPAVEEGKILTREYLQAMAAA